NDVRRFGGDHFVDALARRYACDHGVAEFADTALHSRGPFRIGVGEQDLEADGQSGRTVLLQAALSKSGAISETGCRVPLGRLSSPKGMTWPETPNGSAIRDGAR